MNSRALIRWGSVAALAMLPLLLPAQRAGDPVGWRTVVPTQFTLTGHLTDRRLAEASGAAPSRKHPGLFWTIGDSGNPPDLFAIDTSGALRGRFTLQNVTNVDWEAVAIGPCPQGTCVYVGDLGDNGERRAEVTIHRVTEPEIRDAERVTIEAAETVRIRYPRQSHDVEAMAVTNDGTILLVTKGRSGGVLLYHVPASAWDERGTVVATLVDSLPIQPQSGNGRLVTDMALDPSGIRVVVRTYRDLFIFDRAPNGRLSPIVACNVLGREPQGEGITWLPDGRFLLVSERGFLKQGVVSIVSCS